MLRTARDDSNWELGGPWLVQHFEGTTSLEETTTPSKQWKTTADGVMVALTTCTISSQLYVFLKSNHPLLLLLLFVAHSIRVVRHFLLVSTHDCLTICTGTLQSQFGLCIAINKTNKSVSGGYHRPFEA